MSSLPRHADSQSWCHQVIVVSAMGSHPGSKLKVTDLLLNMVAKAVRQDDAFLLDLAALQVQAPPARYMDSRDHCACLTTAPPKIIGKNACLAGEHLFGSSWQLPFLSLECDEFIDLLGPMRSCARSLFLCLPAATGVFSSEVAAADAYGGSELEWSRRSTWRRRRRCWATAGS